MRGMALVALLCVWASAHVARADPCGAVDDPNQLEHFPDAPALAAATGALDGRWPSARAALVQFARSVRDESDPALRPSALRLVALARRVLSAYDGTAENAHLLAVDDVTPKACGDIEVDGIPERRCAWTVLRDPPVEVPFEGGWSCDQKARFGSYVKSLRAILSAVHGPHVEDALFALERHDYAWERLVTRGFSQYPWEVWLHGALLPPDAWGPSPNQLIALHPSAGFGVQNLGRENDQPAAAAAIIALEAIGYVRYFREFRQHVGLSVAATVANLEFDKWTLGPVVHATGIGLGYGYGFTQRHEHTLFLVIDVTSPFDDGLLEKLAKRAIR